MNAHTKPSLSRIPLAIAVCLLSSSSLFAQSQPNPAEVAQSMNIIQTILHGGPMIIFIWVCILTVSMVMVTLVIQLALQLRNEVLAPSALVASLKAAIDFGNYQEAWSICRANTAYIATVLGGTLERIGRGKDTTEISLIERGHREAQTFKTKNSYLSVIGVIAPMIGLLGTVIGMMSAFAVLGSSGVSDPRKLALSIGEVLMATASGLFLAIPAFIFYYYFRNRIASVVLYADEILSRLVEDIPYSELEGLRIGENFASGSPTPPPPAPTTEEVSANCPVCSGVIHPGETSCPHCGAALQWDS